MCVYDESEAGIYMKWFSQEVSRSLQAIIVQERRSKPLLKSSLRVFRIFYMHCLNAIITSITVQNSHMESIHFSLTALPAAYELHA